MPNSNEVVIVNPTTGSAITDANGTKTQGAAAAGAAKAGNPVLVGGQDGTNAQSLLMDTSGRAVVSGGDTWAVTHAPAANTQATISQAAGGGTVKNVCTSIHCTLTSAGAATPTQILFHLRDGATGAGTIKATIALSITATSGDCKTYTATGLRIVGTANTAMTLESAIAPGANAYATVAMAGFTLPS